MPVIVFTVLCLASFNGEFLSVLLKYAFKGCENAYLVLFLLNDIMPVPKVVFSHCFKPAATA